MKSLNCGGRRGASSGQDKRSRERGFTLLETSIALVVMLVVSVGVVPLFIYSVQYNSGAQDRELAMAVAQKRMEWLRKIPFDADTHDNAYAYPGGGLAATSTAGVTETVVSAGRSYTVVTRIEDILSAGGQSRLKAISVRVTPQGAGPSFGTVQLTTLRATVVPGTN